LGELAAFGAEPPPATMRFGPDIEPIVRLIEETPRDRCVGVFIDQLRRGLPYRRFLAAVFFAGIRRYRSHHDVYKIHSVHQVSLDARPEERLLPLFWALQGYKRHQEDFPNPLLTELSGLLPAPEKAGAELAIAMEQFDADRAERALVALARNQGARQTMEQLWIYGLRNLGAGGHSAILMANSFRALEAVGWQESEQALRFVVQDIYLLSAEKPDQKWLANTARVDRQLDKLPPTWVAGKSDPGATRELFSLLREGKAEPACDLAVKQLLRGVGGQALWDAIHLATAELMVRHKSGWGLASRPLHANTSTNALHYAFRTCTTARTRLSALLQAVAWAASRTGSDLSDLRDIKIAELSEGSAPAKAEDAVTDIFALLPSRTYRWDAKDKKALLGYGERAKADEASRKVFVLAKERPDVVQLFVQTAHGWLCRKANDDAHEYKFLAAILEDARHVSPGWQPHLLAASVHYFHGTQTPDNPIMQQVREALRHVGRD
ncbi:MAG TPA: hypothetical protein VKE94_05315, partial [Gemmataceae bacterium]|nr:hypothetical protein [Gemmataceae bacterium]